MHQKFVLLFDGECNLCNNAVQFVIDRDKKAKIKFAGLKSIAANELFKRYKISENYFDSIVYIEEEIVYLKSTAALKLAKKLDGLWFMLYVFIIIPKPLRDFVYDFIAKNRTRWFGKTGYCRVMTPELKNRFLE